MMVAGDTHNYYNNKQMVTGHMHGTDGARLNDTHHWGRTEHTPGEDEWRGGKMNMHRGAAGKGMMMGKGDGMMWENGMADGPNQQYFGTPKSYHAANAYGFIDCKPQHHMFGGQMNHNNGGARHMMHRGAPGKGMMGKGGAGSWEMPSGEEAPEKGRWKGLNQEFCGTVKSYNPTTGYGFIDCKSTKHLCGGGRDVFLSREDVDKYALEVGDDVLFKMKFGKNKSAGPRAHVIGKPATMQQEGLQKLTEAGGYEEWFVGMIKSYNEANGFGFVQCDKTFAVFGCDIFLHKTEWDSLLTATAGDCLVGWQIGFRIQLNRNGKPQAWECRPIAQAVPSMLQGQ